MGFSLHDLGDPKSIVSVNFWNWRPTVEIIRSFGILDNERLELMQIECCRPEISTDEARAIAGRLAEYIKKIPPNGRVLLDGTFTSEPDDFKFHVGEEVAMNYSATRDWLLDFKNSAKSATVLP
jgi:hypothetical protein